MGKKSCLVILMTLFFHANILPQSYFFDHYSVAEGLYQSRVLDICKDNRYNIWLATLGGVSCFNGNEFVNYTAADGIAKSGVQTIYCDSQGNIWLGHLGGSLSRISNGKAEIVYQSSDTFNNDITDIIEDDKKQLWISSHGSGVLCLINPNEKVKKHVFHVFKGNQLSDRIFSIVKTKDHFLYFITDVGIKKLDEKTSKFVKYEPEGLTNYFAKTCMFQDSEGNEWFGTFHGGLYKRDFKTKKFKIFDIRDGIASNWITCINEDYDGNIWLGSWGSGLTCITKKGEINVFNESNGLKDNKVRCINTEFDGIVIIGTNENGFCFYKGDQFVKFDEKDGLHNSQIWAITKDLKGRYWFGTNAGISVMDFKKPIEQRFQYFDHQNKLIGNQIRIIINDKNGNLWIHSLDQGIFMFDRAKEKFIYHASLNASLSGANVTAMIVDRRNEIWIGKTEGLIKYNQSTSEIFGVSQANGLLGNEISSLFADSENKIWVGIKGKGISVVTDSGIHNISLGQGITPTCFAEESKGVIWVGTLGQGVFQLSKKNVTKAITEADGLLSNLINLIAYDRNNLYIGTNKGLNVLDLSKNKILTYTYKSGFTGIETKNNSVFVDTTGEIWFGTVQGAFRFTEKKLKNIEEPFTYFVRIKANLKEVPVHNNLKFNYNQNAIIIDYQSICYLNPEAVRYQTQLEGLEKEWQPVTHQRSVSFSALSPGNYTFKVKAINSQGIWNSNPISLSFTIKPPFYKTWWFILSCILLGALLIYSYIKYREKKLVEEKSILEEKVRERTQEVTLKNEELAEKNKNITDSIQYAKRIQLAILPPEELYKDTFIFFKPKDIVSGDFYWLYKDNDREFLAAVDCTGHGVPGAFMSLIGHVLLNKIVKEYSIYDAGEILYKLNQELTETLHSKNEAGSVADGMDLALVVYNPLEKSIQYSGAYNPVVLVRKGELKEFPANRFSIGKNTGPDKQFESISIKIEDGDAIYLYSDGFEDQFGGPNGKKFKRKTLHQTFLEISKFDALKQKEELQNIFDCWKEGYEQIDDVLIIGRKF